MANYGQLVKSFTVPRKGAGMPDYSQAAPVGAQSIESSPVYTSMDTAEQTARLNRAMNFDRRGNVVWMEDFQNPPSFLSTVIPAPNSRWAAYNGDGNSSGACLEIDLQTGAGAPSTNFGPYKNIAHPVSGSPYPHAGGKIGFEVRVGTNETLFGATYMRYWTIVFCRLDYAGAAQAMTLSADVEDQEVRITTPGGNVALLRGITWWPRTNAGGYWTLKIVADFDAGRYMRAMVNDLSFDISNHPLTTPVSAASYIAVGGSSFAGAVLPSRAYIISLIVTTNEPPN